jgi:hypothetical protein
MKKYQKFVELLLINHQVFVKKHVRPKKLESFLVGVSFAFVDLGLEVKIVPNVL